MTMHALSSHPLPLLLCVWGAFTAAAQNQNPTITVYTVTAQAAEAFNTTGTYMVRRTGDTNFYQSIFYELSGTASNGVDYQQLTGSVEMPAGAGAVPLTITPIDDSLVEGNETVLVRIVPSPLDCATCWYDIAKPSEAELLIHDDDGSSTNGPPIVRILEQPRDTTSFWDCKASFSVRVEVDPPNIPVHYQWQRNQVDLPGATNATYTSSYLTGADNDALFRCHIRAGETEALSTSARLTLGGDLVLPQLRTAFRFCSNGIALVFNYPVEPGDLANYEISPSLALQSVETLSHDPAIVLLRTSPLTPAASYTITVRDLQSSSGNILYPNPSRANIYVHDCPSAPNTLYAFASGPCLIMDWRGPGWMLQSADTPLGPWLNLSSTNPAVVLTRPTYCDGVPQRPHQFFRLHAAQ